MWYWIAVTLLMLTNFGCLVANLLTLPGNWAMLAVWGLYVWAVPTAMSPGWHTVLIIAAMAVLGEILESFSGTVTAARKGASRRAIVFSLLFSILGSIAGALMLPIPVIGSAVGAVLGAAAGAFAGAWLGEASLGAEMSKRHQVGTAAMTGRMLGMLAKVVVGAAIVGYEIWLLWQYR